MPALFSYYGPLVKRSRRRPLTPQTGVRFSHGSPEKGRKNRGPYAPLAQLVEQLTLNQRAQGSSPWRCTKQKSQPKQAGFFVWRTLPRLPARRCPGGERRLRRMQRAGAGCAATGLHRSRPAGAPVHLAGTLGLKTCRRQVFLDGLDWRCTARSRACRRNWTSSFAPCGHSGSPRRDTRPKKPAAGRFFRAVSIGVHQIEKPALLGWLRVKNC